MDEQSHLKSPLALTGATGFIGSELQRQLVAAGHPVRALIRPGSLRRQRLHPAVEACEVALDDADGVRAALTRIATVVYCAGAVRGRTAGEFAPANIDGLRTVCRAAAAQRPAPRIILISSLAASRPQLSDYSQSKFAGENVLRSAGALAWTILRPPAVYGPGDREMLPLFRAIRAGLALQIGPPDQRLSLLHVSDLARAVLTCLDHAEACNHELFELDDGRVHGYGWDDIIAAARGRWPVLRVPVSRPLLALIARANEWLAERCRYAPMLTQGKVRELSAPNWLCDNSALGAATGWVPQVQLRAGLDQLFGGNEVEGDDVGVVT